MISSYSGLRGAKWAKIMLALVGVSLLMGGAELVDSGQPILRGANLSERAGRRLQALPAFCFCGAVFFLSRAVADWMGNGQVTVLEQPNENEGRGEASLAPRIQTSLRASHAGSNPAGAIEKQTETTRRKHSVSGHPNREPCHYQSEGSVEGRRGRTRTSRISPPKKLTTTLESRLSAYHGLCNAPAGQAGIKPGPLYRIFTYRMGER